MSLQDDHKDGLHAPWPHEECETCQEQKRKALLESYVERSKTATGGLNDHLFAQEEE